MAANIMHKAAHALERQNNTIRKFRAQHAQQEQAVVHGLVGFAGAGSAGLIDSKWKSDQGGPAAIKGVPANAAIGLGLLAVSMVPGMPGRGLVAAAGAGFAQAALYRYALDHVQFSS